MESVLGLSAVQWTWNANRIPLSRPSATLSPARSGGEGRERGRFMERFLVIHYIVWSAVQERADIRHGDLHEP